MAAEPVGLPPEAAIAHFRGKDYHVGFDWRDTAAAEHLASFTVAKAMKLDILADIRAATDRALADGLTFREFARELEPVLRRKGWWGRSEMVDPKTGDRRLVQLGSLHRLRTIYDTNIRMAIARGRWDAIRRLGDRMPYLRYVATLDTRTRPDHARWHGTVLPYDHPWWETHAPPNGWRCRCLIVQLSERQLERRGYKVSPDPVVRRRTWHNARTGRTVEVPAGIDPGFDHNPGNLPAAHAAKRIYRGKLDRTPAETARAAEAVPTMLRTAIAAIDRMDPVDARRRVAEMLDEDAFAAHARGLGDGDWPVAAAPAAFSSALGAQAVAIRFSDWTAARQLYRHEDVAPADYGLVQQMVDAGEAFRRYARTAVVFFTDHRGWWWRCTVKATGEDELYLTSLHRVEARAVVRARRRFAALDGDLL